MLYVELSIILLHSHLPIHTDYNNLTDTLAHIYSVYKSIITYMDVLVR